MSDLISRSELIKFFKEHIRTAEDFREIIINIIPTIKNQPTAYDVDKVVEDLELHSFEFGTDTLPAHYVRLNDAIEIVKHGSVADDDDVCEWEYASTSAGKFIRNPHTNRLHSNEQAYCNICGKKIKAVE